MISELAAVPAVQVTPIRRASVRYQCQSGHAGEIMLAGEYITRQATVMDLSTGGVALKLSRAFPRGTSLLLQLRHADLGVHYTLAICVAHCTELPGRKWKVGCAFARELSEHEVHSLL
jgi:hypothetical protein